jgi:hypothetical protein
MPGYSTNPMDYYPLLPYPYPLFESFPVVRIPVAGPEPFNTLVCVRGRVPTTHFRVSDGKLESSTFLVGTGFTLAGNTDQRLIPVFQHSTTGSLQHMQSSDDTAFVHAVDAVVGAEFIFTGAAWVWTLTWRCSIMADEVFSTAFGYFSSWVLCYEPPVDPHYPHAGARPYLTPFAPGALRTAVEVSSKPARPGPGRSTVADTGLFRADGLGERDGSDANVEKSEC